MEGLSTMHNLSTHEDEIKDAWVALGDAIAAVLEDVAPGAALTDSTQLLAAALDAGDFELMASAILAHDKSDTLQPPEVCRLFAIANKGQAADWRDKAAITYLARVFLGEVAP
jgi:hypothetical protein